MTLSDVLGWLLGVGGTLFAVYTYFKSKRFRRLRFAYRLGTLHTRTHPEMRITYRDHEVESLAQVTVYCWSDGPDAIRAGDLPTRPTISVTEPCRILSAAVIQVEGASTEFAVHQRDEQTVELSFFYLNYDHGAIIELILANFPRNGKLNCAAPIVGGKSDIVKISRPLSTRRLLIELGTTAFPALVGVGLVFAEGWNSPRAVFGYGIATIQSLFLIDKVRHFRRRRAPQFVSEHASKS